MDQLHHHALQVEYALVSKMLLVPNVQLVSQAFLDFPTAKVTIKQLCYLVRSLNLKVKQSSCYRMLFQTFCFIAKWPCLSPITKIRRIHIEYNPTCQW